MEMKLAGNIRLFRKHRGMTQEQLAEVLGVTIGAVHKWETGMSTPELGLIAEMSDFFDVSMDILVGYEMKDNRLDSITARLSRCINEEDPEGLNEAEKALSRFPHSFDIVYLSAVLYMIIGGKNHDDSQLSRASELLENAMVLLPQSGSEKLSEITIYEMMSNVRMMQGHGDQAAELLKKHNRDGIYNDQIGLLPHSRFQGLFGTPAERAIHGSIVFIDDGSVHDFRRRTRHRQAAQHFRADRNERMPRQQAEKLRVQIVSAVILAVFAQQAGADHDFHFSRYRLFRTVG